MGFFPFTWIKNNINKIFQYLVSDFNLLSVWNIYFKRKYSGGHKENVHKKSIIKTRRIYILCNKICEGCRCFTGQIIHLLWGSVSLTIKSSSWMTGHIKPLKTRILWIWRQPNLFIVTSSLHSGQILLYDKKILLLYFWSLL